MKNRDALNDIIQKWMQSFEHDQQILDILTEARVPSGPVLAPYDAIGHPYFESRGAVQQIHDPLLGICTYQATHYDFLTSPTH